MCLFNKVKKGVIAKAPKIMLIGVEGVGKSTAGASMPSPIFICGESGLVGPQFADTQSFTPANWGEILQFCDELSQDSHGFKTVVIDTLDWIEPMLYASVCANQGHGLKNIEDFGYGKGYVVAQQEARQLLSRLDRLNSQGFAILILSHCQIKTVNNPMGDNYDHFEPKVNAKIAGIFREWCDAVLFANFDIYTKKDGTRTKAFGGQGRIVQTTHSAAWDAKNRYGLPDTMPFDMNEIMNAINATQPIDVEPLVKELKGYIAGMDEKKAEKWNKWLDKNPTAQELAEKLNTLRVKNTLNNNDNKDKENA